MGRRRPGVTDADSLTQAGQPLRSPSFLSKYNGGKGGHLSYIAPMIEKIASRVRHDEVSGCMVWTGDKTSNGYGRMVVDGKRKRVHRLMYERVNGEIPDSMVIDHVCRNRLCCNPEHLRVVSNRENILSGEGIAAKNAAKTHCVKGHELSGHNLVIKTRKNRMPERVCRKCKNGWD